MLLRDGIYEYCAFHCQQASEKSLKSLLAEHGREERTHSGVELMRILERMGTEFPEGLTGEIRRLDRAFVDSRYPSGLGGAPQEFYDQSSAEEHLAWCRHVMAFVKSKLA